MFDLKRACVTCPFRKSVQFALRFGRVVDILDQPAFQCHKTVDYSGDNPAPGAKPQQCAGLMLVLHRSNMPNQIMQVGQRLGHFDPSQLVDDPDVFADTFETLDASWWER